MHPRSRSSISGHLQRPAASLELRRRGEAHVDQRLPSVRVAQAPASVGQAPAHGATRGEPRRVTASIAGARPQRVAQGVERAITSVATAGNPVREVVDLAPGRVSVATFTSPVKALTVGAEQSVPRAATRLPEPSDERTSNGFACIVWPSNRSHPLACCIRKAGCP